LVWVLRAKPTKFGGRFGDPLHSFIELHRERDGKAKEMLLAVANLAEWASDNL